MRTNQPITKPDFAPGSWHRPKRVHSLALRIAEELDLQLSENETARREAIGERLRELRGPRTQRWVADRVGVSERAYQNWEAGDSGITWENIEALAKLYSVPEDFVVYGSDRRSSPDQLDRIEGLLVDVSERLAQLEDLVSAREIEEAAQEIENGAPPEQQRPGKRGAGSDAP